MRRVLLTGAGGFVGATVAAGLAARGLDILATDLVFDAEAKARLGDVEHLEGDLRDTLPELARSGRGVDGIFHGAAVTASPQALGLSAAEHMRLNADLLFAALDFAVRAGARRFVFVSSAAVFAPGAARRLDETAEPDGLTPYAAAKRAGEIATACLGAEGRIEAASVRLGNLYGPEERPRRSRPRASLVARMLKEARSSGRVTVETPHARRDWTYLPDLVEPFAELLTGDRLPPPLLHLCSPFAVTDRELGEAVASLVPGTRVEASPGAQDGPARSPLTSRDASSRATPWTGLRHGLETLTDTHALA